MMERWTEGPLIVYVIAWMDLWEKEMGQETGTRGEKRGYSIANRSDEMLHPSFPCGRGDRISMSRLGLILVCLAGHLLLRTSKLVCILLCRRLQRKKRKIVV